MPKEYNNPSKNIRKTSGDLDDTKKALVTTTDTVVKEWNTEMVDKKRKTKPNVVKEPTTPPISAKNNIYTVNKTDKSKASNRTVDTPKRNKTEKIKSIDKSKSTKKADTENSVDKSRSIPRANLSNKSNRIENSSKIDIHRDNFSISVFLG